MAVAVVIAVLALVACASYLFVHDPADFQSHRSDEIARLTNQRAALQQELHDIAQRQAADQSERASAQDRAARAERVIVELKPLESTWAKIFGDREQQHRNAEQIARMEKLRAEATTKAVQAQQNAVREGWAKDGVQIELSRVERRLDAVEHNQSAVVHYLDQAWLKLRLWLVGFFVLYFLGGILRRFLLYFALARWVVSGEPIRMADDEIAALPQIGESERALEVAVWPGEVLVAKPTFLPEHLPADVVHRRVFSWRIPLTCLACGLTRLTEMRNKRAGGSVRVMLTNPRLPDLQLTIVQVPDGASFVLRPSYLVGVVQPSEQKLLLRRRWQFFRWQSWALLRFRFFEFVGPCRLLVAAQHGFRGEWLTDRPGHATSWRITQGATVGFTPELDYKPVRAESFRNYFRGRTRLFDDLFAGEGVVLALRGAQKIWVRRSRRPFAAARRGVLRLLGAA